MTIKLYTAFVDRLYAYVSIRTRIYAFMFSACLFFSIFFCAVATAANKYVYYNEYSKLP